MKHLFFGASHAFFMAQCVGTFSGTWDDVAEGPLPITGPDGANAGSLMLASPRARLFETVEAAGQLTMRINAHYARQTAALDEPENRTFFLLGGNEHNAAFMHRHAVPFDFDDERCRDRLLPGRQIIPRQVVRDRLQCALHTTRLQLMLAVPLLARTRQAVVAPPPPIPSDDYIRSMPEVFDFARAPIEDRWVRLKVYRVYLEALAQVCAELGLRLLQPPAQCLDEDGFLAEAFWNCATHAKPAYYRPILDLEAA